MTALTLDLPDALSTFVDDEAAARGLKSGADYVLALIRQQQARHTLRGLLLEGANSGVAELANDAYFQNLRDQLRAPQTSSE